VAGNVLKLANTFGLALGKAQKTRGPKVRKNERKEG